MCAQYEQRIADLEESMVENKDSLNNYGNFSFGIRLSFRAFGQPKKNFIDGYVHIFYK